MRNFTRDKNSVLFWYSGRFFFVTAPIKEANRALGNYSSVSLLYGILVVQVHGTECGDCCYRDTQKGRGKRGFSFRSKCSSGRKTGIGDQERGRGLPGQNRERERDSCLTPCVMTRKSCCPCSFCVVWSVGYKQRNPVTVETLIVMRELRYCVFFLLLLFFTPSPLEHKR